MSDSCWAGWILICKSALLSELTNSCHLFMQLWTSSGYTTGWVPGEKTTPNKRKVWGWGWGYIQGNPKQNCQCRYVSSAFTYLLSWTVPGLSSWCIQMSGFHQGSTSSHVTPLLSLVQDGLRLLTVGLIVADCMPLSWVEAIGLLFMSSQMLICHWSVQIDTMFASGLYISCWHDYYFHGNSLLPWIVHSDS